MLHALLGCTGVSCCRESMCSRRRGQQHMTVCGNDRLLDAQMQLLAALRPLQPRLYSISSSQLEHPTRVQVPLLHR